ncbi:MAG: helicase-related protein [Deltaproteobacteria bacterium]
MKHEQLRRSIVDRFHSDLIGPGAADEVIQSRPTDMYLTAILYPQESDFGAEDDDSFGGGDEGGEPDASEEGAVPLISTLKPSSAGISFSVSCESTPSVRARIRCGTYNRDISGVSRAFQRTDHDVEFDVELTDGDQEFALDQHGLEGLSLFTQVAAWDDPKRTVTAALVNRQVRGDTRNESEERSFFQVKLSIAPIAPTILVPRPSRRSVRDDDGRAAHLIYRDAQEMASGHSCAADWHPRSGDGAIERVETSWLPEAVVPAVSAYGDVAFEPLRSGTDRLSGSWLSTAPPADLDSALTLLISCYEDWIAKESARIPGLDARHHAQAKAHLATCSHASTRMRAAVTRIQSDVRVRRAFQLAQTAMVRQRCWALGETDLRWYPFQLAFQLLVLESLLFAAHEDRDVMDLLWFPTGGGKTEAYLAITAMIVFYRRLTAAGDDDGAGVSVIMRYTLRLLTIQQFERAAALVCACEDVRRREGADQLGAVPFSIGLWVGNSATPGTIKDAFALEPGSPTTHKQLTQCPCCKGDLKWTLHPSGTRVECDSKGPCALRELEPRLPVWTIDEDIYREAPSLVIGTVDKFAQIVRKPDTGILFARDSSRSPPDLIIQDELHLISGPLGTMTGLYETAIDEICAHIGSRPKVVGSTATIRRAKDQVQHLFARKTFQFPPPGLDASNSGFAVYDPTKPGRLYLGVSTAGRSAKFTVQALSACMLQAATLTGPTDDVRDAYWTLVAYFNTLRELGGSLVLMQDDVKDTVTLYASRHGEQARGLRPPAELTSRVSGAEIRSMLDELKLAKGKPGAHDILLASNMISVGMDIPRLGLMLMVGQPKTISEYIQATSRVGRSFPGLVVSLYNNSRVRDRAHFETFQTWHGTLYREVEATSVTPFASRARDKALHAVLVALIRHLVPGMAQDPPTLTAAAKAAALNLIEAVEKRVDVADSSEVKATGEMLRKLLDAWENESGISKYWDDYGKTKSLLMSAEQHAASMQSGQSTSRALWPTPNSMREVEPGTPFVLVPALRSKEE